MDLRKASLDDIAMELSRRNQKFLLFLVDTKRAGAEMHCGNMEVGQAKKLLEDAKGVFDDITEHGKIPDNCNVTKRVCFNGKIINEIELDDVKEVFDDPWKPKNEIGEFNPWVEGPEPPADLPPPETQNKIEQPEQAKTETPEDSQGEYDPWK